MFVRHLLTLSLTVAAFASSTGCSRAKWLSRKDYSEMHDPFMGSPAAVADNSEDQKDPSTGSVSTGVAQLAESDSRRPDDASADSAGTGFASLSGPKPIQRRADAVTRSGSPFAQAAYPGDKTANAGAASSEAVYPSDQDRSSAGTVDLRSAAASTTSGGGGKMKKAASGPSLSDFMSGTQEAAAGSTSSPAAAKVHDDFASWASQQQSPTAGRASENTPAVAASRTQFPAGRTRAPVSGASAGNVSAVGVPASFAPEIAVESAGSADSSPGMGSAASSEFGSFAAGAAQPESAPPVSGVRPPATNRNAFQPSPFAAFPGAGSTGAGSTGAGSTVATAAAPEFDDDSSEVAEPLIRQQAVTAERESVPGTSVSPAFSPSGSAAAAAAAASFENPFSPNSMGSSGNLNVGGGITVGGGIAVGGTTGSVGSSRAAPKTAAASTTAADPFAAFDNPAAVQKSSREATARKASGFEMDSGWKPSYFARP